MLHWRHQGDVGDDTSELRAGTLIVSDGDGLVHGKDVDSQCCIGVTRARLEMTRPS